MEEASFIRASRRRFLQVGAGIGIGALAGCQRLGIGEPDPEVDVGEGDEVAIANGDWPAVQSDVANTGHNSIATGPTGTVEEHWSVETDGRVSAGPVVVGGSCMRVALTVMCTRWTPQTVRPSGTIPSIRETEYSGVYQWQRVPSTWALVATPTSTR